MESRVEGVWLGGGGEVSLDITALTQYSGQGKCRKVLILDVGRYREKVRSWAQRLNWSVVEDIKRIWIIDMEDME